MGLFDKKSTRYATVGKADNLPAIWVAMGDQEEEVNPPFGRGFSPPIGWAKVVNQIWPGIWRIPSVLKKGYD